MKGVLLVAEDEADLQDIICSIIEVEDIDCIKAKDGQEAYEILTGPEKSNIDAILSDIKMPRLDGLALIQKIREGGSDIPFVFLSGFGDKDKAIQALRYGAFDFQDKPFDRKRLVNSVKAAIDLGQKLKTIEHEVDEYFKTTSIPDGEKEQHREKIKSLLLLKKQRETQNK